MLDEPRLSHLADDLLDSHIMQYKAGIDGGGGSKVLPGHPAEEVRQAYEELKQAGLIAAAPVGARAPARWELTPKGKRLASCLIADPS